MHRARERDEPMKYQVKIDWSGYSRGTEVYEVEADSEQEARDRWCHNDPVSRTVDRDDCEREIYEVEEVK